MATAGIRTSVAPSGVDVHAILRERVKHAFPRCRVETNTGLNPATPLTVMVTWATRHHHAVRAKAPVLTSEDAHRFADAAIDELRRWRDSIEG